MMPDPAAVTMRARPAVRLYVAIVVAGGVALVAGLLRATPPADIVGRSPAAFWMLFACLLVAELRPLRWLRPSEGGEVTASWTFAFALLFVAPPAGGLLAIMGASLLADLASRKPPIRMAFNAAQLTLSLAVGVAVLEVVAPPTRIVENLPIGPLWMVGASLAVAATFATNSVLIGIALALHEGQPLRPVLRECFSVAGVMDAVLLALGPVFAVVAVHALTLLPLLVLTILVVHHSTAAALSHRHEATHDLLTGIPNRRYFDEQSDLALAAAQRSGEHLALLHLDLDGFKGINDRLGHHVGDLVLKEVAARLLATRRPGDVVARLGGDEFAVLLRRVPDAEAADTVARRILATLNRSMLIEGLPLAVGGSIGISLYPQHGDLTNSLLQQADLAMYRAKSAGCGVAVHQGESDRHGAGRLALLAELGEAMNRGELALVYQPRIDLTDGAVLGVEALVRWNHPRLGVVAPQVFVPIAEQTDLMERLTLHVCRLAAEQSAQWRSSGLVVPIAINVSARNLTDLRFPRALANVLAEVGVPTCDIELEITEHTVIGDPARSAAVLAELHELGLCLALDDFGTGYSSLTTLRDIEADWVKIDRSFVANMVERADDAVIVRSIIDLARSLGRRTVAEGVEDPAVARLLADLRCDAAQGYLFARPLPAADLQGLLLAGGVDLAAMISGAVTGTAASAAAGGSMGSVGTEPAAVGSAPSALRSDIHAA